MAKARWHCIPDSEEALIRDVVAWLRARSRRAAGATSGEALKATEYQMAGYSLAQQMQYGTAHWLSVCPKGSVSISPCGSLAMWYPMNRSVTPREWVRGLGRGRGVAILYSLLYFYLIVDEDTAPGSEFVSTFGERIAEASASTMPVLDDGSLDNVTGIGLDVAFDKLDAVAEAWFDGLANALLIGDSPEGLAYLMLDEHFARGDFVSVRKFERRRKGSVCVWERFPNAAVRAANPAYSESYLFALVPKDADLNLLEAIWHSVMDDEIWGCATVERLKKAVDRFLLLEHAVDSDFSASILWQRAPDKAAISRVCDSSSHLDVFWCS